MSETLTAAIKVDLVTPRPPNVIRVAGRKDTVSIADLDNDTLVGIANRWRDALLNRADEIRNNADQVPDVSQYPHPPQYGWTDAAGASFDPEVHSWSRTHGRPGVTKEGVFKRRRGTAGGGDQLVESTPDAPAVGPETSPLLQQLIAACCESEHNNDLVRLENHPRVEDLADEESATLAAYIQARRHELSGRDAAP